jgi:hypothetical protein
LTVSAGAAALNVGLLSAHQKPAFTPTLIDATGQVVPDPPKPDARVVYQDVYEHVSAPTVAIAAQSPSNEPSGGTQSVQPTATTHDDAFDDDAVEVDDHEAEAHETEHSDGEDSEHGTGGFDD